MAKVDQIRTKAAEFFQKGKYDQAITEYKKVLELEPDNASVYNFVGDAYSKLKDSINAVNYYTEAIKGYKKDALFNNAIAVGKKVLRITDQNSEIYNLMGEAYANQGLLNEASKHYTTYAELLTKDSQIDKAKQFYIKVIQLKLVEEINKKSIDQTVSELSLRRFGCCDVRDPEYGALENHNSIGTATSFMLLEEYEPHEQALDLAGILMEIGSVDDAIKQFHLAVDLAIDKGKIYKAAGICTHITRNFPSDILAYQKLTGLWGKLQSEAYFDLAVCLEKREMPEAAKEVLQKAVALV